jgi:3-methyl-2-oxobutanoate hydroxymethyltransferase
MWPPQLKEMKERGEKIAVLTAYDALMAQLLDRAGIDVLLVGDSLGMVLLGYDTTIPVTMDVMVHHTKAVSRGTKRALVVADMPFLSFQISAEDAIRNAGRLMQEGGANAV